MFSPVKRLISRTHIFLQRQMRVILVAFYYKKSISLINQIYKLSSDLKARKQRILNEGLNPYIYRTMLDYTRYPESKRLHQALQEQGVRFDQLKVLDFGCLVSDYGTYFAKLGCKVTAYDYPEYVKFVKFRSLAEGVNIHTAEVGIPYSELFSNKDLAIFGEVLEHLDSPLDTLKSCMGQQVKFIFTSCFPFGDGYYYSLPGHRLSAFQQQDECIHLLRENYVEIALKKKERLWKIKNV